MATLSPNAPKDFLLYIGNLENVVWTSNYLRRLPNLYVEVNVEGVVQRTRVIKRSMTPSWDIELPLSGKPSSILSLLVKHESTKLATRDTTIGSVDIELNALLNMCQEDMPSTEVTLKLSAINANKSGRSVESITVQLSMVEAIEGGAVAIANAQQDVKARLLDSLTAKASRSVQVVDAAINNAEKSDLMKALGNIIKKLDIFIEICDKTAKVHPYINLAWQITSSLYKALLAQIERDQKVVDLVSTMESVYSFVDAVRELPNKIKLLEDIIIRILNQTVECAIFIREYTKRGFTARLLRQTFSDTGQTIDDLSSSLVALKEAFDSGGILQIAFVSTRALAVTEELYKIEYLKKLKPVSMDASSQPECLPNTRQDILRSITDWLTTPSQRNVLWLHGLAGSGKSTIAMTLAEYFRDLRRLGAFMFFDKTRPVSSDPSAVVRTLAFKLASFDRTIKDAVCAQIERDPGIIEASIRTQFHKLLVEPLSSLPQVHTGGPIVVILDALDECGDQISRKTLLSLFTKELDKFPPTIRFLFTSRRESDIDAAFSRLSNVETRQLDTTNQANSSDIASYLRHHMAAFREDVRYGLPPNWPGEDTIDVLTQISAGLFVWASTAIGFIADGHHPDHRLNILLSPSSRREAESPLDTLYGQALDAVGNWDDTDVAQSFRAVLGTIVLSRIPLTETTMDQILGLEGYNSSTFILSRLRCLIQWSPGQPVRILHQSFADYLTDSVHCKDQPWYIDASVQHRRFTSRAFERMKADLKFNICDLETSYVSNDSVADLPVRIEVSISTPLSYACRFWSAHLRKVSFDADLLAELNDLLRNRLLFWMEVLSLVKEIPSGLRALLLAAKWARGHDDNLAAFATDANAFLTTFEKPIALSTPHIYISALAFAPTKSLVLEQYGPQYLKRLSIDIGAASDWQSDLTNLDAHVSDINCVACSPDGTKIVSASDDKTIRVWDMVTGQVSPNKFSQHMDEVNAVAFSPDGLRIVSGSADQSVRVWDALAGTSTSKSFEGHAHWVSSVAFSPNGKWIASGSLDKTIRVWDVVTGKTIYKPIKGHGGGVYTVAFSPNGERIASGSDDKTIRLWNANTGAALSAPFIGHTDDINCVGFSPDGQHIVSASDDQTIIVWKADTGSAPKEPFVGHTDVVNSVAYSADGKRIVSGSSDMTVRVWDASSGRTIMGPFVGHLRPVWSVLFSPSGKRVVSGSLDQTIRVWDIEEENSSTASPIVKCDMSKFENGWMKGKHSEFLFWVPPYYREGLWWPKNTAVMGRQATRLVFDDFVHGTAWTSVKVTKL